MLSGKLCNDQRATVLTDVESDEFRIARGTKQGDLLSSLLFHSVLQSAVEKDTETWNDKGLGIKLSDEKRVCMSNVRFADDVHMLDPSSMSVVIVIVTECGIPGLRSLGRQSAQHMNTADGFQRSSRKVDPVQVWIYYKASPRTFPLSP